MAMSARITFKSRPTTKMSIRAGSSTTKTETTKEVNTSTAAVRKQVVDCKVCRPPGWNARVFVSAEKRNGALAQSVEVGKIVDKTNVRACPAYLPAINARRGEPREHMSRARSAVMDPKPATKNTPARAGDHTGNHKARRNAHDAPIAQSHRYVDVARSSAQSVGTSKLAACE